MNATLIVQHEPLLGDIYQHILETLVAEGAIPQSQIYIVTDTDAALEFILQSQRKQETLDFCLLDYGITAGSNWKNATGISIGHSIKTVFPECKILMTAEISESYAMHSILDNLNPDGFLIKGDVNLEGLKHSIVAVQNGQVVYSRRVKEFIRKSAQVLKNIDKRDWKILQMMAQGMSLPEIASEIGLSLSGVEYRKRKIAQSLGAPSSKVDQLLNYVRTELKLL